MAADGGFAFKRFAVRQDRCAMKVGTDGVLLGAWARGGRKVLDIGTGTGLIALMVAQRCPGAAVTAIDIDAAACSQAAGNIAASPFAGRVEVAHRSLQDLAADAPGPLFDSVVSNPPFFADPPVGAVTRRTLARQAVALPYRDLFAGVSRLLSPGGAFSAIIPTDRLGDFMAESFIHGFFLHRRCLVRTVEGKPPKRALVEFSLSRPQCVEEEERCLHAAGGVRSGWYAALTSDFYL